MGAGTGFDQTGNGTGVQTITSTLGGLTIDATDPANPTIETTGYLPSLILDSTELNITSDTNNLDTLGFSLVLLNATGGPFNITGIDYLTSQDQGKLVYLVNTSSIVFTIKNLSGSSILQNRFDLYPAADLSLNPKQVIGFVWVNGRWRTL